MVLVAWSCFACHFNTNTGRGAAALVGRGVVNNPQNKSLRFDMIKYGLDAFCRELLERGAPLRLTDGQPVIGRYFGSRCNAKSIEALERDTIVLQFSGQGYAWTAGTGRLGFRAAGLLELAPDFRIYEEAMYVYFRPVQVDTSAFELLMTEQPMAEAAAEIAGIDEEQLGKAIIDAQLGRGFTAIRYDADGHADFALGLIEKGSAPFLPYRVLSSPRATLANGRTELFAGQQDFIGRIAVKSGQPLTITLEMDGAPSVDFALLSEQATTPHLQAYLTAPGTPALQVTPSFVARAVRGTRTRAEVSLPPGRYYLVLDHSRALGQTSPEPRALPARVDYLIQSGRR